MFIGRAEASKTRANNCQMKFKVDRVYSSGGLKTTYRDFMRGLYHNWDYVGVQFTSEGIMDAPINNGINEIDGCTFAGYDGVDECGRRSIAMTNDEAGRGKGILYDVNSGNYGFAFCTPIFMRRLRFDQVTLPNRWQFSRGKTRPGRSDDYGFSECQVFDEDGSMSLHYDEDGTTTAATVAAAEPLLQTRLLLADAQRRWPTVFQEDCKYTLNSPDWWDTGDDINAVNRCPPFLRREPELLSAALDMPVWGEKPDWNGFNWGVEMGRRSLYTREQMNRQGVVHQLANLDMPDWAGRHGTLACQQDTTVRLASGETYKRQDLAANNALDCDKTDFVYLRNLVPKKIVSGSQVTYGPVGISSCTVPGGKPTVNLVDAEEWVIDLDVQCTSPSVVSSLKDGRGGRAYVQPQWHFVPNGGCYRVDYTGDIGVFERNVFSLMNTKFEPAWDNPILSNRAAGGQHMPRVRPGNPGLKPKDWAVILEIPYGFPGKINVYVDEAFVPPSGRRSMLSLSARNGANYYHPIARIMNVVVKSKKGKESKVKLKLLKVVQVNLVITETFEGPPLPLPAPVPPSPPPRTSALACNACTPAVPIARHVRTPSSIPPPAPPHPQNSS